jgi:iron-sulfur cluster repair protein YtfE (RIC family)
MDDITPKRIVFSGSEPTARFAQACSLRVVEGEEFAPDEAMENIPITQFLRDHHKTIRGLLAQCEAAPARAPSMEVGVEGELLGELELHCRMEEETLYPALQNSGDTALRAQVDESFHDHGELKQAVGTAWDLLRDDRLADLREHLETIRAQFEAHAGEEEHGLFTLAENAFDGGRLVEMTERARAIRDEFTQKPGVASRRPEVVQNPNGGEQMRKVV